LLIRCDEFTSPPEELTEAAGLLAVPLSVPLRADEFTKPPDELTDVAGELPSELVELELLSPPRLDEFTRTPEELTDEAGDVVLLESLSLPRLDELTRPPDELTDDVGALWPVLPPSPRWCDPHEPAPDPESDPASDDTEEDATEEEDELLLEPLPSDSALATAVPPARAAPIPRVIAPALSQVATPGGVPIVRRRLPALAFLALARL